MKTAWTILIAAATIFIAFYLGRTTTPVPEPKVEIQWRTRYDTVEYRDTVKLPVPYEVVRDTTIYLPGEIDTAALLADYLKTRHYELHFGNDSIGQFDVYATVHRNELAEARSVVNPLIREIIRTERVPYERPVPWVRGYAQVGTSINFKTQKFSAGVDLRDRWMIGGSAIRINDHWGYTIDVGTKF